MSYLKKLLFFIVCGAAFLGGVIFEQTLDVIPSLDGPAPVEIGANGSTGVNSGDPGPFPDDWRQDPYYRGNAPIGGGPQAESGPGILLDPSEVQHPPSTPRINPAPPVVTMPPWTQQEPGPYDDPKPLTCSRITYGGKNINATVEFTVPAGWSVWKCIKERFPSHGDRFIAMAVKNLQWYIDYDPTLTVRDANVVPVFYRFYMGGDGGGALPGKQ